MIPAQPIYHIEITFNACHINVRLNDFPLASLSATSPMRIAPPVNQLLVGKENSLHVEILPVLRDNNEWSNIGNVSFEGAVKVYEADDIVAPETGTVVAKLELSEFLDQQTLKQLPLFGHVQFENEGPDFHSTFYEGEVIEDRTLLIRYALLLKDLLKKNRISDELVKEFYPKLHDYADAYYKAEDEIIEQFRSFITDTFMPSHPLLEFNEDLITIQPFCGKRIWRLGLKPDKPLFLTAQNSDGESYEIPIYVAQISKSLKVIR